MNSPLVPPTERVGISSTLRQPSCRELFLGFLGLGMMAFGGALPLMHRLIVERHHWADEAEFAELLGLCQFLPGGSATNLAVALGMRRRGWRGALSAVSGLVAVPSVVVVVFSVIYRHFQHDPQLGHVFGGLAAAAAGLLIALMIRLLRPMQRDPLRIAMVLVCFGAIAGLRLPMLLVMIVLTPVSILLCARRSATERAPRP